MVRAPTPARWANRQNQPPVPLMPGRNLRTTAAVPRTSVPKSRQAPQTLPNAQHVVLPFRQGPGVWPPQPKILGAKTIRVETCEELYKFTRTSRRSFATPLKGSRPGRIPVRCPQQAIGQSKSSFYAAWVICNRRLKDHESCHPSWERNISSFFFRVLAVWSALSKHRLNFGCLCRPRTNRSLILCPVHNHLSPAMRSSPGVSPHAPESILTTATPPHVIKPIDPPPRNAAGSEDDWSGRR